MKFFTNVLHKILKRILVEETYLTPVRIRRNIYRVKMVKTLGGKEVSSEIISGNLSRTEIVKVFMNYRLKV